MKIFHIKLIFIIFLYAFNIQCADELSLDPVAQNAKSDAAQKPNQTTQKDTKQSEPAKKITKLKKDISKVVKAVENETKTPKTEPEKTRSPASRKGSILQIAFT